MYTPRTVSVSTTTTTDLAVPAPPAVGLCIAPVLLHESRSYAIELMMHRWIVSRSISAATGKQFRLTYL